MELFEIKYEIRRIRKQKGYTLDYLAQISELSRSQINDIENNKKHPTIPTLYRIAVALEVDIFELFTINPL